MATVKAKMYYVGQGAMNLIWVENGRSVLYAALIDAGSTADPMGAADVSAAEADGIIGRAQKVDIFITHLDADHYNYLGNLDGSYKIENWYLGSFPIGKRINCFRKMTEEEELDYWDGYFCKNFSDKMPKFFAENYLWDGESVYQPVDGVALEIVCLMANWGEEVNDRTAIYLVRTSDYALIFPGDMTGNTFINLVNSGAVNLCRNFVGKRQVFMSVPHHGSLTTLFEGNFVSIDKTTYSFWTYDMSNLKGALTGMGAQNGIFLASAGLHKGFLHPRSDVMSTCAGLGLQALVPQKYICYRGDYEGASVSYGTGWISPVLDGSSMGRAVYTTLYNRTASQVSTLTPVSSNKIKDYTQEFDTYSYRISSYRISSMNGESKERLELTAYDSGQRPVFRDCFCREESGIRHMGRNLFCAEKGEWE